MEKGDWEFKWDGIGRLGLLMLGSWEDENISWGKMKTRKSRKLTTAAFAGDGWMLLMVINCLLTNFESQICSFC